MKPIMQMEIEINDSIDRVHIFKIDQFNLINQDARIICERFCMELFNEICVNKKSILFFNEEITIGNKFTVYIFVFCGEQEISYLFNLTFEKFEQIKFYSEFRINRPYIIKNLKKLILSIFTYYFQYQGMKHIKNYMIYISDIFKHTHYYFKIKNIELSYNENRSHLFLLNQQNYLINIEFEIGLIKLNFSTLEEICKYKKFLNLDNFSKIELKEDDKEKYLNNEEITVFDETLKSNLVINKKNLIINYAPLTYKSKVHYTKLLSDLFSFSSKFVQFMCKKNFDTTNNIIDFISLKLTNIIIEKSDHSFYNARVELLADELKNQNSENCLNNSEQINKFDFISLYNYLNKINIDNEIEILEFFGTFILLYHYKEIGKSSKKELTTSRFSLMPPIISKISQEQTDNEIFNKYCDSININGVKKENIATKSLLKPYNKETILKQDACIVDYGGKNKPKKYFDQRDKYIIETIDKANKEFFESYENDVKLCNFEKVIKKVKFNLTIEQISNKDL